MNLVKNIRDLEKIHPLIRPLAWMIGKWMGENGVGVYPTIKTFEYKEELEISHPAPHQPVLHIKFSSWFEKKVNLDNGQEVVEKKGAHFETGFLKAKPNSSPLFLSYTSTHNNGIDLVEEGVYDESRNLIVFESIGLIRSSFSKPPFVQRTKRELQLSNEDTIGYKMYMSTSTHADMDLHLSIEYKKIN